MRLRVRLAGQHQAAPTRLILPADSLALRYLVQAENRADAEERGPSCWENAEDEQMLTPMDADYADRVIPRKAPGQVTTPGSIYASLRSSH